MKICQVYFMHVVQHKAEKYIIKGMDNQYDFFVLACASSGNLFNLTIFVSVIGRVCKGLQLAGIVAVLRWGLGAVYIAPKHCAD
jgi:hypothetical protein